MKLAQLITLLSAIRRDEIQLQRGASRLKLGHDEYGVLLVHLHAQKAFVGARQV
jgi:hypothetical protein